MLNLCTCNIAGYGSCQRYKLLFFLIKPVYDRVKIGWCHRIVDKSKVRPKKNILIKVPITAL